MVAVIDGVKSSVSWYVNVRVRNCSIGNKAAVLKRSVTRLNIEGPEHHLKLNLYLPDASYLSIESKPVGQGLPFPTVCGL